MFNKDCYLLLLLYYNNVLYNNII